MADQKITDLSADAAPTTDDLLVTVDDVAGTPTNKKVTLGDVVTLVEGSIESAADELAALPGSANPDTDDRILVREDDTDVTWATPTQVRTTLNVEDGADVTDATNVDAAGAVMESDYDANTILKADSDNTPTALTMGASTILARLAAGSIVAATPTQLRTLINVEDGADVTDATNVNAAGAVMESDYDANTILAATSDNTPTARTVAEQRIVGRITGGAIAGLTPAEVCGVIDDADIFAIKAFGTTAQTFSNTTGRRISIEQYTDSFLISTNVRLAIYGNNSDTEPIIQLGTLAGTVPTFGLGAGGSTAPDTAFARARAGVLSLNTPASTVNGYLCGRIKSNITAVGNVGTGDDTLQSLQLAAGILATNGDTARYRWTGTFANNANAKALRIKWNGTTVVDSGALPTSVAGSWRAELQVTRTGATTQDIMAFIQWNSSAPVTAFATGSATLSSAITGQINGEAVSNNDVVSEILLVDFEPGQT